MYASIGRGVLGVLALAACLACGCSDNGVPGSGPRSARAGSADGYRLAAVGARPVGVDDQDDPAWPTALPRSGEVGDWVKTVPLRVALSGELATLISDADRVARWTPYQIKLAATCRYTRSDGGTADVAIVQAYSVEDAFGLFSIEAPRTGRQAAADHSRVTDAKNGEFHAWKGRFYVRITGRNEGCSALLSRILFVLPDAEWPPILGAFPAHRGGLPARWLVRGGISLTGTEARPWAAPDAVKVDRLLGLSRDTLMAVAEYPTAAAGKRNTLWLVQYDTPAAAREAFKRYRRYANDSKDADAAVTMVVEPKGPYLLGTWTAEEESIANLLPRILHVLPG